MKNIIYNFVSLLFATFVFSQNKALLKNPNFIEEINKQTRILKTISASYLNTENNCNISSDQLNEFSESIKKVNLLMGIKPAIQAKTASTIKEAKMPIIQEKEKPALILEKKPANQTSKIMAIVDEKFPSVGKKLSVVKEKNEVTITTQTSEITTKSNEISNFGTKLYKDLGELLMIVKLYKLYIEIDDCYLEQRNKKIELVNNIKNNLISNFPELQNRIELVEESKFNTYFNKSVKKISENDIKFSIKM